MEKYDTKNRMLYPDVLRIIASMGVVIIHVTAMGLNKYNIRSWEWNIYNACNSLVRWSVPIFFMISGMLFLNPERQINIKAFIRKYVVRIVICIVFWGYLYALLDGYIYNRKQGVKLFIIAFVNIFSGTTGYHLWFLYTILMIYLLVPILKCLISNVNKSVLQYAIYIWLLFGIGLGTLNGVIKNIPQELFSGFACELPELLGYIGYFLLGYYLENYKLKCSIKKKMYVVFWISAMFIPMGDYYISVINGEHRNVFSNNFSIFIAALSITIFVYWKEKEINITEKKIKFIQIVGQCTFGIYLIHVAVLVLLKNTLNINMQSVIGVLWIPILSILTWGLSFLITLLLKMIPIIRKIV